MAIPSSRGTIWLAHLRSWCLIAIDISRSLEVKVTILLEGFLFMTAAEDKRLILENIASLCPTKSIQQVSLWPPISSDDVGIKNWHLPLTNLITAWALKCSPKDVCRCGIPIWKMVCALGFCFQYKEIISLMNFGFCPFSGSQINWCFRQTSPIFLFAIEKHICNAEQQEWTQMSMPCQRHLKTTTRL